MTSEIEEPIEVKKKIKRPREDIESPIKSRQGDSKNGVAKKRINKKTQKKSKYPVKTPTKKSGKESPQKVKEDLPKPKIKKIYDIALDLTGHTPGEIHELDPNVRYVQVQIMSVELIASTLNHYEELGYKKLDFAMTPIGKIWIILEKIEE